MSLYVPAGVVFMVSKRGAVKVKLKQRGQVGRQRQFTFPVKDHVELGLALDLFDFEAACEVCSAWPYPFESNWMPQWYIKPRDSYFGIQQSVKLFSTTSHRYSQDVTGQWNKVLLGGKWGGAVGVGAHKLDTFSTPVQGFCAFEYSDLVRSTVVEKCGFQPRGQNTQVSPPCHLPLRTCVLSYSANC